MMRCSLNFKSTIPYRKQNLYAILAYLAHLNVPISRMPSYLEDMFPKELNYRNLDIIILLKIVQETFSDEI